MSLDEEDGAGIALATGRIPELISWTVPCAVVSEPTLFANLTLVVVKREVIVKFAVVVEADPLRLPVLDTGRGAELARGWEDDIAIIERVSVTTGFLPVEALSAIAPIDYSDPVEEREGRTENRGRC
jgi:hypothetical protein